MRGMDKILITYSGQFPSFHNIDNMTSHISVKCTNFLWGFYQLSSRFRSLCALYWRTYSTYVVAVSLLCAIASSREDFYCLKEKNCNFEETYISQKIVLLISKVLSPLYRLIQCYFRTFFILLDSRCFVQISSFENMFPCIFRIQRNGTTSWLDKYEMV